MRKADKALKKKAGTNLSLAYRGHLQRSSVFFFFDCYFHSGERFSKKAAIPS